MSRTNWVRWTTWRQSLRVRVTLGIALPLVLILLSGSLVHYWRTRQMLDDQMQLTATQLGDTMLGSLRHAMMGRGCGTLDQIVSDVGQTDAVHRVVIVDPDGQVLADSLGEGSLETWPSDQMGCIECHSLPVESMPRVVKLPAASGTLRISTPIGTDSSCTECHWSQVPHLGMLMIDVLIPDAQKQLIDGLRIDLAVAVGGALLVTFGLALLIHLLVTRRVEAFRLPLAEFAGGDFSSRLPSREAPHDELDELATTFNQMADELQRRVSRQEERAQVRQSAIVEERERIARELHDGMAQLLAYVNTKVVAARLMLKNGRIESATQNLIQLEGAARELFVDVRQAVLDLRAAGQIGVGLPETLRDFAVQFSKFSDVPAEVHIDPRAESLDLSAEVELQLLRIVQEALTNVRKHASARKAQVSLAVTNGCLQLAVSDDGTGFDVERARSQPDGQFGLATMRERAEDIGAKLTITSQPGSGTHLSVLLPIGELS